MYFLKNNIQCHFKSKLVNELVAKLKNLIITDKKTLIIYNNHKNKLTINQQS